MKKHLTIIALFLCSFAYTQDINVGHENFEKLANFIEKNGQTITLDGLPIYKVLSFVDSHKNVHKIRIGGVAHDEIMVDSYYNGKLKANKFFDWEINEEKATACNYSKTYAPKYIKAIRFAYNELLKKAIMFSSAEDITETDR